MSKSEWLEILQIVGSAILIYGSKYLNRAKKIFDEFESMKEKQLYLEKSIQKAWEKIDKLKNLPK